MSWPLILALVIAVLIAIGIAASIAARTLFLEREKGSLKAASSLADIIERAKSADIHILYVHGMRANGRGHSRELRQALAKNYRWQLPDDHVEPPARLPLQRPDEAKVGEILFWTDDASWTASLPFVDRYVFTPADGGSLTVHEVNWWPLLFPLKCRLLIRREHDLAGDDPKLVELCACRKAPYHPWITPGEKKIMLGTRPRSGGGARINAWLKRQIIDWGFADAVIALGPMRKFIREAIDIAFAEAAADASDSAEFVVITESLGSFVVLDAYQNAEGSAARDLLDRTDYLFFFANQFALLELARMHLTLPGEKKDQQQPAMAAFPSPDALSPLDGLSRWAGSGASAQQADLEGYPKQVVAFNDPSDALTFDLPCLPHGARTVNVYVRNAIPWFGLFAMPGKAHRGGLDNARLWRWMLSPNQKDPTAKGPACVDPAG